MRSQRPTCHEKQGEKSLSYNHSSFFVPDGASGLRLRCVSPGIRLQFGYRPLPEAGRGYCYWPHELIPQITRLSVSTHSSLRDKPNSSQKISVLCWPISGAWREIRQGEPL